MLDILRDTIIDALKILPFLFITYLIMEYIEHKMSEKSKETIKKSGRWGPLLGAAVGILPQCGFSASATNLYSARVITLGTLIAVYLSTSDEMIPIFLSEHISAITLIKILTIKFVLGIFFGFIIDLILRKTNKKIQEDEDIKEFCEHNHCHCEKNGILKSSIKHTLNILLYIFIVTLIINILVEVIGEESIANFVSKNVVFGPFIASLIGLIPNCAASVILTNLYIENILNGASLVAGLLTGAGVGLIILFRTNKNVKENIFIVCLLYIIGVISGLGLQFVNII